MLYNSHSIWKKKQNCNYKSFKKFNHLLKGPLNLNTTKYVYYILMKFFYSCKFSSRHVLVMLSKYQIFHDSSAKIELHQTLRAAVACGQRSSHLKDCSPFGIIFSGINQQLDSAKIQYWQISRNIQDSLRPESVPPMTRHQTDYWLGLRKCASSRRLFLRKFRLSDNRMFSGITWWLRFTTKSPEKGDP